MLWGRPNKKGGPYNTYSPILHSETGKCCCQHEVAPTGWMFTQRLEKAVCETIMCMWSIKSIYWEELWRNVTTWPIDFPSGSGALCAVGDLGNLILGPVVMFGSPSWSWLSNLPRAVQVQVSLIQSVICDSFCSSSDVKLECLSAKFNYSEVTFIRSLKWGPVGILSDEHGLSLSDVVWQCMATSSMLGGRNSRKCMCMAS